MCPNAFTKYLQATTKWFPVVGLCRWQVLFNISLVKSSYMCLVCNLSPLMDQDSYFISDVRPWITSLLVFSAPLWWIFFKVYKDKASWSFIGFTGPIFCASLLILVQPKYYRYWKRTGTEQVWTFPFIPNDGEWKSQNWGMPYFILSRCMFPVEDMLKLCIQDKIVSWDEQIITGCGHVYPVNTLGFLC